MGRTRAFIAALQAVLVPALSLAVFGCADPFDLCTPQSANLAFFSKGDCVLTRAQFFQGHEWLTYFGNKDLDGEERFSASEIAAISDGNRRVDWPKEMLVHMNNGVLAYVSAVTEHTDRPENQRLHFLLTDRNDSAEAAADSRDAMTTATLEALEKWTANRARALALIGQTNHILQDSFSPAHTVRDESRDFCIVKVKAFIERADEFDTSDIEYHGTSSDTIGHTTSLDSIYREGRDCHEPTSESDVEACLSEAAKLARLGTTQYLQILRQLVARVTAGEGVNRADVESAFASYYDSMLSLCP
jgi:hypothetical protein